jgi:hypothetical protein
VARDQSDLLQGTLELMVLKTLSVEPMHGWGITQPTRHVSARATFSRSIKEVCIPRFNG